jgi:hypothetical protein
VTAARVRGEWRVPAQTSSKIEKFNNPKIHQRLADAASLLSYLV